jgi:hypothetical protein
MRLDENFPVYPSIGERDVNLLLIEELATSTTFQSRFFTAAGIKVRASADAAGILAFTEVCLPGECSAEIDVIAAAMGASTADGKSAYILIEDKVDSDPRPLQPERYRAQAERLVAEGFADVVKTLLLAPAGYLGSHRSRADMYDSRLSYEEMQEWLLAGPFAVPELERRAKCKANVLAQGISKQKRLLPQIISPTVSLSWKEVYDVATTEFPDLCMSPPGEKGRSSWSIDLPCITRHHPLKNARLEYVLKKGDHIPQPGTVTILLPKLAEFVSNARSSLGGLLSPGMNLRKAGGSLGITISVDYVEPGRPFGPQRMKLVKGFKRARFLRMWYENNRAELERFASRYLNASGV